MGFGILARRAFTEAGKAAANIASKPAVGESGKFLGQATAGAAISKTVWNINDSASRNKRKQLLLKKITEIQKRLAAGGVERMERKVLQTELVNMQAELEDLMLA